MIKYCRLYHFWGFYGSNTVVYIILGGVEIPSKFVLNVVVVDYRSLAHYTGNETYSETAQSIVDVILREQYVVGGGFFAALYPNGITLSVSLSISLYLSLSLSLSLSLTLSLYLSPCVCVCLCVS